MKVSFAVKRAFDVVVSLISLVVVLPFLIIGVIGILITMPGPIFFKQERIGRNKKEFFVLKLRTMKVDKEIEKNRDMSHDDERKTKWGNLLRRFKIDEIPQLINVLKGDMSLIGPRPTVIEHVVLYNEKELHRLDVRPGMTGLAQVNGNGALVWEDRIEYDLRYIDNFSLLLDIKILIKTVQVVLLGENNYCHPLSNLKKEESKYYW